MTDPIINSQLPTIPDPAVPRSPTPEDDHERLRALVEEPHVRMMWGKDINVTPHLLSVIFGDGKTLWGFTPVMTAPQYYVIRGDSRWYPDDPSDIDDLPPELSIRELYDEILSAISEEFGCETDEIWQPYWEDEYDDEWPAPEWPVLFDGGCSWFALDWPEGWGK